MRELGERSNSLVIGSEAWVFLSEGSLSDVLEELNLLEDKEVNPCDIVADDKLLVSQEFLDTLHTVGNFDNSVFISRAIAMAGGGTLDVRNDSKHHVNMCLIIVSLSTKV